MVAVDETAAVAATVATLGLEDTHRKSVTAVPTGEIENVAVVVFVFP